LRYLDRIYGAVLDEDLFVLDYDRRRPLGEGARALAKLIARVRGAGDDSVDLIGFREGGNAIRAFLAGGAGGAVRRVIYVATPHRGSIAALWRLAHGDEAWPSLFDLLPHDRVFLDGQDHLDPATWRGLRLPGHDRPGLAADLARAREGQRAMAAASHPPSIVIAARHVPTAARIAVEGGKLSACGLEPGDGELPASTTGAAPGLQSDGPWWIRTSNIEADPRVRPMVVEALLSPVDPVPRERYQWPRNPEARGVQLGSPPKG
jgi:hypothetical protein